MPVPMLKAMAKEYGLDISTVEAHWNECKKAIKPKGGQDGYGLVVNCVKAKCREAKKGNPGRSLMKHYEGKKK